MVEPRKPVPTVAFVDEYCQTYRNVFADVRNFEALKYLHLGMISEIPRKSLPVIARTFGLKDGQELHHFLRETSWDVKAFRELRLWLIKETIGNQPMILCIDETGDEKKGQATDYVAKQYIGNLGRATNGIVSVNAYAVVENITSYPLIFKIFKPRSRIQLGDEYKTKPQLAVEILREVQAFEFNILLVLVGSMYGESGDVIGVLSELKLPFIVAIRSNHPVWLLPGQRVRYRWRAYEQKLSHRKAEQRFIREIIFGKRHPIRYYQISKSADSNPKSEDTWFIMTNLPGNIQLKVAGLYSLRNWIEYGFKQIKNELG